MALVVCESVADGLRPEEKSVTVRNAVSGGRSSVRVEADFLTVHDSKCYLPVGVVQEEPQLGLLLVELPQEPDAGSTRLWVRTVDVLKPQQVPA
jgi:hypothetical protein